STSCRCPLNHSILYRTYIMLLSLFFLLMILHPPISTLFPYTTLFRSVAKAPAFERVLTDPVSGGHLPSASRTYRPSAAMAENLRSEEHTSELQSRFDLVCRLLLENQ